MMIAVRSLACLALMMLGLNSAWPAANDAEITVFGAASLTDALQQLGAAFQRESTIAVKSSFAASSVLARQIESGARADLFFAADLEWMDYLQSRELIDRATRREALGNRLVLIAPADSRIQLKIAPKFALLAALGAGRLATGDPDSVPVGRYARSALTSLGLWNEVQDRLVRAENVRSALTFVDRGEVPLGIVYETDALIDRKVRIVDVFPADSHLPIVYPVALTRTARPQAARFLQYILGPAGNAVFEKYGFKILLKE